MEETTNMNQGIIVRKVLPGESRAVWRVAKTLSILERFIFYCYYLMASHKKNVLVAVDEGKIVGCVIPAVDTLAGEKIGSVDGIFVDRNAQKKGVGKALAKAALSHLQKAGCKTYYVLVDRFNSPSWNMFLHKGFAPFEFNEQFRVYGWKILSLWRITGYLFCPGTFILRKTTGEKQIPKEVGESWHFLLAILGFSFIVWTMDIRIDTPLPDLTLLILGVLGVVGVSILVHELSHKLVASLCGLKTVFKVWESGLIFSALLAMLGAPYPCYGSTFIKQKDWPYYKHAQKMGLIYVAGPVVSLILAFCFLGLAHWADTGWLVALGKFGLRANFVLALFNLIPIFPFNTFDGSKIFLWNKFVWLLLVVAWFVLLTNVCTLSFHQSPM